MCASSMSMPVRFSSRLPSDCSSDKLLLPLRSTRTVKRRSSLFEKSRDWARRIISSRRINRRNTSSNDKIIIRDTCCTNTDNQEKKKKKTFNSHSLDEDGYLSPLEIKAKLENISQEDDRHYTLPDRRHSLSRILYKSSPLPPPVVTDHGLCSSNSESHLVYRCQSMRTLKAQPPLTCLLTKRSRETESTAEIDDKISPLVCSNNISEKTNRSYSLTSFAGEYKKSLISHDEPIDYIDFDCIDGGDECQQISPSHEYCAVNESDQTDDVLQDLKLLFDDDEQSPSSTICTLPPIGNLPSSRRRLAARTSSPLSSRRSTNTSSISTDSGCYMINSEVFDQPTNSVKMIPLQLISCTLCSLNSITVFSDNSTPSSNIYLTENKDLPSSLSSANVYFQYSSCNCHQNHPSTFYRNPKLYYPQSLTYVKDNNLSLKNSHSYHSLLKKNKYSSTKKCYSKGSGSSVIENYNRCTCPYYSTNNCVSTSQHRPHKTIAEEQCKTKETLLSDDERELMSAPWYKPNIERETVCDALQKADYGMFILRNSKTHIGCFALSIKVPKYYQENNIAHYLIEKVNNQGYRVKGTIKIFPSLSSLITHHSVMPETFPITLNLAAYQVSNNHSH
ncbi:unnamed protein product [Didymodactylos carnosus]|uniref:SH2 domain-containing protein n=1 Tax=Didymodactylos carnosus TaxID=1234261 RepID=A0A814BBM9_9BILA|nr:unnamed protein product [Didymodactylos carnosus]CAF0974878.1 unnamed protein product [Didymodactylos carnosus]CAF3705624.1 unnamed protein product [Didymodactylos carnosus]CAF3745910.1 unnamed protein product [Didymodactylos carnosus]